MTDSTQQARAASIPASGIEAAAKHMHEDEGYFEAWADAPEFRKDHFREKAAGILEAAAPIIRSQTLEDAAEAISSQRDSTNPNRSQEESWSVIDHRAGRFLGKTVAIRLLRARAATAIAALEAAEPFIKAQALDTAADDADALGMEDIPVHALRNRANRYRNPNG